jgi:hypothetical protein
MVASSVYPTRVSKSMVETIAHKASAFSLHRVDIILGGIQFGIGPWPLPRNHHGLCNPLTQLCQLAGHHYPHGQLCNYHGTGTSLSFDIEEAKA